MTDFEHLYRSDPDPWCVGSAWYERRKRAVLMASLPRERYGLALELGCGTGETTRLLADRSDGVNAADISPTAVDRCRWRLARDGIGNVRLATLHLPAAWPLAAEESADLIVASELAYYFRDPDLDLFFQRCMQSLAVGGDWVLCHYKAEFHDRLQETARMHETVAAIAGLRRVVAHEETRFRLDIYQKHDEGIRT